jgi:CBS domain-containing protein
VDLPLDEKGVTMQRGFRGSKAQSAASGAGLDTSCCVAEVMGTELFTLTPDTVVGSALRLALAKHVHHFLVIEQGSLTGIVCESDLRQARHGAMVSDCMKSPVLCIGPDTTVGDAANIMRQNHVGCLPVVTGAFLVGIVTRDRLAHIATAPAETADADDDLDLDLDLESEGDDADEVAAEEPTCVACGGGRDVRPQVMAGLLDLCRDCAASIPAADALRTN